MKQSALGSVRIFRKSGIGLDNYKGKEFMSRPAMGSQVVIVRNWYHIIPQIMELCQEQKIYLMAGDKIDRFGGKKGKFFSPTGTPMEMRALPYGADLSQYRQFEVVKPFEVEASTIAPAFGNIGLGTQYRSSVSVDVLLKKGIIKQVGGN